MLPFLNISNSFSFFFSTISEQNQNDNELIGFALDFTKYLWDDKDAYRQFFQHILVHVVGHGKMSKMSNSYNTQSLTFNKAVSISDEAFACMILDDRWLLWNKVAEVRKAAAANKEPGCLSLQRKEENTGDEDDQREEKYLSMGAPNGMKGKLDGDNLTRFSMFGEHAPGKRGFNANFASAVHVHYCKKIQKHRKEFPQYRKEMRDWYCDIIGTVTRKRPRNSYEDRTKYQDAWGEADEDDNSGDEHSK